MGSAARPLQILVLLITGLVASSASARDAPKEAIEREARVQRSLSVQAYLDDMQRIEQVAYPLLRSAVPYCVEKRKWDIGAWPKSRDMFKDSFKQAAEEGAGLSESLTFLHVVHDSPVARAGIVAGDVLQSLDGEPLAQGSEGIKSLRRRLEEFPKAKIPLKLEIRRDGATQVLEVSPHLVCDVSMHLAFDDRVNASAAIKDIVVSNGMLRFAGTDDELALVIGHEIAHIALRHTEKRLERIKAGTAIDILAILLGRGRIQPNASAALAQAYSQDDERDADEIGLYIAAASGYRYQDGPGFWRRMAVRQPRAIEGSHSATHPSTAERFVLIDRSVAEIDQKTRDGKPLAPDHERFAKMMDGETIRYDRMGRQVALVARAAPEQDPRLTDVNLVPFLGASSRVNYETFLKMRVRPRAFAISQRGSSARGSGPNASYDAIQTCERFGHPCAIYALDDRVVWNPEALAAKSDAAKSGAVRSDAAKSVSQPVPIADPRLADAHSVPHLDENGKNAYEKFLAAKRRPRAFALNLVGNVAWKTGPDSAEEARAACESHGSVCFLYAVDDRVVWEGIDAALKALCDAAQADPRLCDVGAVPVREEGRERYKAFLLIKTRPRAFVISASGGWRSTWGPGAADRGLEFCRKSSPRCRVYAEDDRVVWER